MEAGARPRSPQMIEKIGGRGGTRTRGPLLAKQVVAVICTRVARRRDRKQESCEKRRNIIPPSPPDFSESLVCQSGITPLNFHRRLRGRQSHPECRFPVYQLRAAYNCQSLDFGPFLQE